MTYYFAYGSNLDENQMRERCPGAKLIGKSVLKDYKLGFTIYSPKRQCGCADIIKRRGDEVWGLIYELTAEDLKRLDGFEMHPYKYKRFTTEVVDEFGNNKIAETYEVVEKSPEHIKPSREYYTIIVNAVKKNKFPGSYQKFLSSFEVID